MNEAGQFKVPVKLHLKRVRQEIWAGVLVLAIFLAVTVYVTVQNGWTGDGVWAMWSLVGSTVVLLGWASWWTFNHKEVSYTVNGFVVTFADFDWFIPQTMFTTFIEKEVYEPFRPTAEAQGMDPAQLLRGKRIIFTKEKPRVLVKQPDGTVAREEKFGATWPAGNGHRTYGHSMVWAPQVLNPGVSGWEMKLLVCHVFFPNRSEAEDLAWMKKEGIV